MSTRKGIRLMALCLCAALMFGGYAGRAFAEESNDGFAIGNYITFGVYPQTAEGKDETPIEWLVLDRDGEKALLISRYGLDAQPYYTEWNYITWEQCTLRTWLNDTFLNKAFTSEEQKGIVLTNVDNSKSQCYSGYSTNGGNNTLDKIFLLSYAEANKYFGVEYWGNSGADKNVKSRVEPTAYAIAQGAWTSSSNKTASGQAAGVWRLRSPGYYQDSAALVDTDGYLSSRDVNIVNFCVRPALWVNLKSDIFQSEYVGSAFAEDSNDGFAIGNYVTFGTYPQTKAGTDKTPIEWLVLDRDGNKALIISRYGLDAQPYNADDTDITWEECTLRTWLNGTFLNKAFTSEEKKGIILTNVDNCKSQGYGEWDADGGHDTQDKVFLLSYAEANQYFGVAYYWTYSGAEENAQSCAAPTAYAIALGAETSSSYQTTDGQATGSWWLRSPSISRGRAAYVFTDGSLLDLDVNNDSNCVRPALWVNLDSDVFQSES